MVIGTKIAGQLAVGVVMGTLPPSAQSADEPGSTSSRLIWVAAKPKSCLADSGFTVSSARWRRTREF